MDSATLLARRHPRRRPDREQEWKTHLEDEAEDITRKEQAAQVPRAAAQHAAGGWRDGRRGGGGLSRCLRSLVRRQAMDELAGHGVCSGVRTGGNEHASGPRGASFEEEELSRGETIDLQLHAPASGGLLLSPTVDSRQKNGRNDQKKRGHHKPHQGLVLQGAVSGPVA